YRSLSYPPVSRAHQSGGAVYRAAQTLVGAATADVGEVGIDLRIGRIPIGLEKGHGRHDLSGLAVAALRHLLRQPGLLNRMLAVGREALNRRDLGAVNAANRHRAGAHGFSIDVHRTGAARRDTASEFRSREPDLLAQHPKKRGVVLDIKLMR